MDALARTPAPQASAKMPLVLSSQAPDCDIPGVEKLSDVFNGLAALMYRLFPRCEKLPESWLSPSLCTEYRVFFFLSFFFHQTTTRKQTRRRNMKRTLSCLNINGLNPSQGILYVSCHRSSQTPNGRLHHFFPGLVAPQFG